ncbi:carboxymuconolactone decarboxylase family protein [Achromobacter sp. SD115]|uniref:carboxymuconolactone decarboxylase family protein n=1 Tax=Achromobacter sp. SD115 TaxID=2782011 RepID=UPI001A96C7D9|nr:carboxymuconolactone decarboxylase family protein [Achromobacter sp. SD115]MBO1016819.1 carboxymuconolactone decarboxylase family protein [Achromobacter sp. SD115]
MTDRIDYTQASPEGYKSLTNAYLYLQRCGLPTELVDLVYLRVSLINGCAYCIDMHARELRARGVADDKLALLPTWREAGLLYTAQERAALAWAERLTLVAQAGVADADYDAVAAVFNAREIADLSYAVCLINSFNRLAIAFHRTPQAVAALQV